MDLDANDLLHSILSLHSWREEYNDTGYGFGLDQYAPEDCHHYPEAYALWGQGYLNLYQALEEDAYLDHALSCAHWLIDHASARYEHSSWGLPWSWDARDKDVSYITTTTMVGTFLLNLHRMTNDRGLLRAITDIADWILEENGYHVEDDGIWFNYSDHQSLQYPIFNAISMASGFFAQLSRVGVSSGAERISLGCLQFTFRRQNPDGSWYYSTKSPIIDNVHTGFTLAGIVQAFEHLPRGKVPDVARWLQKTDLAREFYLASLYSRGLGYERVPLNLRERLFRKIDPVRGESRLIGYAAGIRAFKRSREFGDTPAQVWEIVRNVIVRLQNPNGSFKYRSGDDRPFVRHQAHIFDALTSCLPSAPLENGNF
jgi:hypothetical protein